MKPLTLKGAAAADYLAPHRWPAQGAYQGCHEQGRGVDARPGVACRRLRRATVLLKVVIRTGR